MNEHDLYPSRNGSPPAMLERLDPVVYARDWSSGPLSREQVYQYDRDGFLILDNLFSADDIGTFQREVERLRNDPDLRTDPATITEPGSNDVRSIFRVHQSSPVFAALSHDPRLQQVARFLLDDEVYIHQSRVNYKPGLRGKEFYWHSDFETWHVEDGMPRMRALSMSITLTDNFAWNGSLMLIPGSQRFYVSCSGETPPDHFRSSLQKQELGIPDDDSLQELARHGGIVTATGKPGSVIVFDCNTMHGSNGNITPFPRSNVFFVFNAVSNRVGKPFGNQPPRPDYICTRD